MTAPTTPSGLVAPGKTPWQISASRNRSKVIDDLQSKHLRVFREEALLSSIAVMSGRRCSPCGLHGLVRIQVRKLPPRAPVPQPDDGYDAVAAILDDGRIIYRPPLEDLLCR